MKKTKNIAILLLTGLFPSVAFADGGNASDVLGTFSSLITQLLPIFVSLAVLFLFFGMAKFILQAGSPEGRKAGLHSIWVGILVLFVMVSFWGLIAILQNTFGISQSSSVAVPSIGNFTNMTP
jgi:hypothetical protein